MTRLAALAVAALCACGGGGEVTVHGAHVVPHPTGAGPAGGFMEIENGTDEARRLVGVTSPDCERVAIHRSVIEEGVARMRPQEAVPLPPGGRVVLEPGGYHLMLMDPRDLAPGDDVSLSLQLDGGRTIAVAAEVRAAGGAPHAGHEEP